MKVVATGLAFAIAVVVLSRPAFLSEIKRCNSAKNCDDNECCIAAGSWGMKKGECKPLAKEGDACTPKENTVGIFGLKKYMEYCPCAKDYICEAEEIRDYGIFGRVLINERCVASNSTVTTIVTPKDVSQNPTVTDIVTPKEVSQTESDTHVTDVVLTDTTY